MGVADLVESQHLSGHLAAIHQGYSHPVINLNGVSASVFRVVTILFLSA